MKALLLLNRLLLLLLLTGHHGGFGQAPEIKATSAPFRFTIRNNGSRLPFSPSLSATSPPFRFDIRRFQSPRLLPGSYALLIANEKYHDSRFRDLPDARLDAQAISDTLKVRFGFEAPDLAQNVTYNLLRTKLQALAGRNWQPGDQLLIYVSGHGEYENGEGFLVMKDTEKDQFNTYFPLAYLKSLINSHPCQHILLVLDICYGGAINQAAPSRQNVSVSNGCESQRDDLRQYFSCVVKDHTRLYLSSGSLSVVRGGKDGDHSPFAKSFLQELAKTAQSKTKTVAVSALKQQLEIANPQLTFTSEAAGDFLFVAQ